VIETVRDVLIPSEFRSHEIGLFVAQLDDQSRRLGLDTRSLTPDELAWQPGPGLNTIGMLLAHIALAEVYWIQVGPMARPEFDSMGVLGMGPDDDGMPLPAGGAPPQGLAGKSLAYFDDLLERARAYTRKNTASLADADLTRESSRTRDDGTKSAFTVRWVLYHILEHEAGHYGQILLLRHLYREARAKR
jgi:uncharacterized damage-inducible protein DinB